MVRGSKGQGQAMRRKEKLFAGLIVLLLSFYTASLGCRKSSQEEARNKLVGEMGVRWSKETFIEAAQNGDTAVVSLFLTAGMQPDVTDNSGKTALIWAAQNGHGDTVKTILNNYADPNAIDAKGKSALIRAAEGDQIACIQALLDKGVNVNVKALDGSTALAVAQKRGNSEIAKLLELAGAK